MPLPNPPAKLVAFNSGPVAPHDIGRQFTEHTRATGDVIEFLKTIIRDDGKLQNGLIEAEQLSPELPEQIAKQAMQAVEVLLDNVRASVARAEYSAREVEALKLQIGELQRRIAFSASEMSKAEEKVQKRLQTLDAEVEARVSATIATGMLGPNTGGPFGVDPLGASATAQDYSQVAIDWAEHMPDTIPPNTLAVTAVTGDHWSSRWWANRAASAFGMMAWWYQGAWPAPGPPSTPNTPTGQPLPPGSMYFNTSTGQMMVWNGSTWVNVTAPGAATTATLYYLASAGQTVFPLSVSDRAGKTFAFNQTAPEGLNAYVNGVRLEPTFDFTVNTANSSVTFLQSLPLNTLVCFDLLTPAAQLAPSGTVNTVLLSPIAPDGSKTTFTGLTVASNGHPTTVAKNEELHVSVNGVIQAPGGAYTASGASITFTEAPEATASVFILWFGPTNP